MNPIGRLIGGMCAVVWLILRWPLVLIHMIVSFPILIVLMVLAMVNTVLSYLVNPTITLWAVSLTSTMAGFAIVPHQHDQVEEKQVYH